MSQERRAELLVLPYASARNRSLTHVLIEELRSGSWTRFRAAVAFARSSANTRELLEALHDFAKDDGEIGITFGADSFGEEAQGSDELAVRQILERLEMFPKTRLYLYHEEGRVFHPKVYLFDNFLDKKALAILGSSNWTRSGQINNVEANAIVPLDLELDSELKQFEELNHCFVEYWSES
ncbi:MAG: phospholipase D family protein [Polyangiales bacterium]